MTGSSSVAASFGCLAVLVSCGGEPTAPPVPRPATPPAQQEIPVSGAAVPGMASFDRTVSEFMRKHAVPGGAVAVMRDGTLIHARGFGHADVENGTPVQPDAPFRIASVPKPITSAAIMKLVEEGRLALDDRARSRDRACERRAVRGVRARACCSPWAPIARGSCDSSAASMAAPIVRTSSALDSSRR